jgi:uncharacterized protein YqeY
MSSFMDAVNAYNEKLSKMTIQDQISYEMKESMKNGNHKLRDFHRVIMGEFLRVDKKHITVNKKINDEQALKVIKKMYKDAVLMENDYEVKILERWLPVMLGSTQTKVLISGIINKNGYSGIQDMGKVMAELKKTAGVDMKIAGQLTKELL